MTRDRRLSALLVLIVFATAVLMYGTYAVRGDTLGVGVGCEYSVADLENQLKSPEAVEKVDRVDRLKGPSVRKYFLYWGTEAEDASKDWDVLIAVVRKDGTVATVTGTGQCLLWLGFTKRDRHDEAMRSVEAGA